MSETTETHIRQAAGRLLPEHARESLVAYVVYGRPPGGFLTAVLSNDFYHSMAYADDISRQALWRFAAMLESLPMACWGSRGDVQAWIERGGLAGATVRNAAEEGRLHELEEQLDYRDNVARTDT